MNFKIFETSLNIQNGGSHSTGVKIFFKVRSPLNNKKFPHMV